MSIDDVVGQLEARSVNNPERLAGELLAAVVAPVLKRFDMDREKDDIGPGVLVHRLRAATKQSSPAVSRQDAKERYGQDLGRWHNFVRELYEWPEGAVIRACRALDGVREITTDELRRVMGPSPLDHPDNQFPDEPQKDDGGKRRVGKTTRRLDPRKAVAKT